MRRRKRKLVRLDMQLKIVLITLFVASLALLINFQLNLAGIWSLTDSIPATAKAPAALDSVRLLFINRFILAAIITIPLAASIGIAYSFTFAGPIFRFRKYFMDMQDGRWDQRISLRKNDGLHDVGAAINETVDLVRARLKSHQDLFKDLEALFSDAGIAVDGKSTERLAQLRQRMAAERTAYDVRFPNVVTSTTTQSPAQAPAAQTSAQETASVSA